MNIKGLLSKSFCWGILVASFTWVITILLYLHLTQEEFVLKMIWSNNSFFKNYSIQTILTPLGEKSLDGIQQTMSTKLSDTNLHISKSAFINSFGVIHNQEDKYIRDMGYKQHAFNALVSNNIGLYRDIPDTRHKICKIQKYDHTLPDATIVMCFYNEHLMTLIRSINTVIKRTPANVLKEIILVDDYSDYPDLIVDLSEKIKSINGSDKIKLIRNQKREGLIRSRVIGARESSSNVLVFLDSHIEVNTNWIEPLLNIIKIERTTLAVPVIDIINADTFEYTSSPLVRGGFNWGLHFKWENLPDGTLKNDSDFAGPIKSPTMAGGLFAINRKYFKELGEYDMGMNIWGGENLELSFRAWQCGGAIKILPCSRVGHIFRKRRPYSAPDGSNTMLRNSMRLANVWMDEFKDFFIKHEKVSSSYEYGEIDDRLMLRKNLKCKNFAWYMKNVYPELELPGAKKKKSGKSQIVYQPWHSRKRTYKTSFMIRLSNTNVCASIVGPKVNGFWKRGSNVVLMPCGKTRNQIWYETERSEIILDKLLCLEANLNSNYAYPVLGKCHEMLGDQQWRYTNTENTPIYNMATGTCLRAANVTLGSTIMLDLCTKSSPNMWDIVKL